MGKWQWSTETQRAWLEDLVPMFVQAQQEKTTREFFLKTHRQWQEKWPTLAPMEDEVEDRPDNKCGYPWVIKGYTHGNTHKYQTHESQVLIAIVL